MGNSASRVEAPTRTIDLKSPELIESQQTGATVASDKSPTMPPKAGALKRPSNGLMSRAARLSETRNESRQRRLPTAARLDPYDIPGLSGNTVPRLKRPNNELARLSPTRQQKKESIARKQANVFQEKECTSKTNAPADEHISSEQEPELDRTPVESRRTSKRQSTTRPGLAEGSVGSAKRHASPAVMISKSKTSAQSRDSGPVCQTNNDTSNALGSEDDTIVVTIQHQQSAQRGRPRKTNAAESPAKRRKVSGVQASDTPNDNSLSAEPLNQLPAAHESLDGQPTRPSAKPRQSTSGITVAKRDKQPVKINKVRPSELFPDRSSSGQGAGDVSEDEVPSEITPQRKKPPKLVLKKKKTVVTPFTELEATQVENTQAASRHDSESDEDDRHLESRSPHLLGQYSVIKKFLRYAEAVRELAEVEDVDSDIGKMGKFCESFVTQLNELQKRPEDTLLLEDPPEELETIKSDVRMLCGKNPSRPINRHNQVQGQSIYYCMLPALVRVLVAMVECYRATDEHEADDELSVTIPHLKSISALMRSMVELGEGAKLYTRPKTSLAVVKPMQDKVLAPLKKIEFKFRRHIRQHAEMQAQRALNREEALRREAAERAEEEAQEEKAKWARVSQKWTQLHEERYAADEAIKPLAKRRHLRQPSPEPEEDHNGHRFTRVEVFRPRVGPPHALVEHVKSQTWPQEAYQALMAGLQEWAGDIMVFERIFRRYCRRNGRLNAYNVTEIVVMAALMKHQFEEVAGEEDDEEEMEQLEWVKYIPDWTKPHTVLEQLEAAAIE